MNMSGIVGNTLQYGTERSRLVVVLATCSFNVVPGTSRHILNTMPKSNRHCRSPRGEMFCWAAQGVSWRREQSRTDHMCTRSAVLNPRGRMLWVCQFAFALIGHKPLFNYISLRVENLEAGLSGAIMMTDRPVELKSSPGPYVTSPVEITHTDLIFARPGKAERRWQSPYETCSGCTERRAFEQEPFIQYLGGGNGRDIPVTKPLRTPFLGKVMHAYWAVKPGIVALQIGGGVSVLVLFVIRYCPNRQLMSFSSNAREQKRLLYHSSLPQREDNYRALKDNTYAEFGDELPHMMEIGYLATDPTFQGRGYATALMHEALRTVRLTLTPGE
ncbi:hypothetical protein K439DRAFT_1615383 [Ramaria rubella]|nr:hypothetical protein K439DRAFT_1615383 [Ramaria rubella]